MRGLRWAVAVAAMAAAAGAQAAPGWSERDSDAAYRKFLSELPPGVRRLSWLNNGDDAVGAPAAPLTMRGQRVMYVIPPRASCKKPFVFRYLIRAARLPSRPNAPTS